MHEIPIPHIHIAIQIGRTPRATIGQHLNGNPSIDQIRIPKQHPTVHIIHIGKVRHEYPRRHPLIQIIPIHQEALRRPARTQSKVITRVGRAIGQAEEGGGQGCVAVELGVELVDEEDLEQQSGHVGAVEAEGHVDGVEDAGDAAAVGDRAGDYAAEWAGVGAGGKQVVGWEGVGLGVVVCSAAGL